MEIKHKDGVHDNGMYIIDYTERYTDRWGRVTENRHRDVAQAYIDSDGQISWMVTGQEWNSVYHVENEVIVLAYIDLINCTCVPMQQPKRIEDQGELNRMMKEANESAGSAATTKGNTDEII